MQGLSRTVQKAEGWLVNRRGQRLYTASFVPAKGTPVAVLCFHHGLSEHISRYDKLFSRMSEQGIAVHGFDAHGHGKSEPKLASQRALVSQFSHLVDDFQQVIESVVEGQPGQAAALPLFVGGHSMGGLVAAHTVLQANNRFSGLLLHSPALDVEWTPVLRLQAQVGNLLATLVPSARLVPAVRPEDMSQDPQVVKEYLEDPLITHGNVCSRTGNELLKAFRQLGPKASGITVPVYVAHGTVDRCTSIAASRRFVQSVSSKDKLMHEFQGGYHELLHGPEWQDAADKMAQWMAQRSAKPLSKL